MFRLSDLSNGFPDNATEKAGEMEQQTARDLSGNLGNLTLTKLGSGSGPDYHDFYPKDRYPYQLT